MHPDIFILYLLKFIKHIFLQLLQIISFEISKLLFSFLFSYEYTNIFILLEFLSQSFNMLLNV